MRERKRGEEGKMIVPFLPPFSRMRVRGTISGSKKKYIVTVIMYYTTKRQRRGSESKVIGEKC